MAKKTQTPHERLLVGAPTHMPSNSSPPYHTLSQGALLTKNTLLNLAGYGAPLLVAVVTLPYLINGLGTNRFGILTLAWVFIGYMSLLDLGLSRAMTKLVAEKLGAGQPQQIPEIIWTAMVIMVAIGIAVASLAMPLIPWAITQMLQIPVQLQRETIHAFQLLAAFIPFMILSVGFRGILDAHQRFDLTNLVRIPMGVFSFCAPLLVMYFTQNLFHITLVLVIGRFFATGVQFVLCSRIVPSLLLGCRIKRRAVPTLLRFGGWMTVTNVINPLLVNIDRFFIGAVLSVSMVAYYATPAEVVTKLLLVSGALIAVLFPAFSATFANDPQRSARLLVQGVKYIYLVMFPLVLMIVVFAEEALTLWVGSDFARQSFRVTQWLGVGVFIHSLAQTPYAFIQGVGRPDLTAKLHFTEFPIYLLLLWAMLNAFGIQGAAMAWCIRMAADLICMSWLAGWLSPGTHLVSRQRVALWMLALLILFLMALLKGLVLKLALIGPVLVLFALMAWYHICDDVDRSLLSDMWHRLRP